MNPVAKKAKPNSNASSKSTRKAPDAPAGDGRQPTLEESITTQLKNRMLASGEWLRLQKAVMAKLRGSEWEESLRCEAEGRALQKDGPTLANLVAHLRPIAHNTIPADVKQEISACISAFIKANVEQDGHDDGDDDDDEEDEDEDAMEEVV